MMSLKPEDIFMGKRSYVYDHTMVTSAGGKERLTPVDPFTIEIDIINQSIAPQLGK
jgi:hypothetical protein